MFALTDPRASLPVRTVLSWQIMATVLAMTVAAYVVGLHGVLSAGLGGGISMAAGLVFAMFAKVRANQTAPDVLVTALKAEGAKLLFVIAALFIVMLVYREVVPLIFIGTFTLTILISSMAFFVGGTEPNEDPKHSAGS